MPLREMIMRTVPYPTPGEILLHEFLEPMGITQNRLAKSIGVSELSIGQIVSGHRDITADTGLRLSHYFGTSEGFWIGLQQSYDLKHAIAGSQCRDFKTTLRRFINIFLGTA